jgi:serine/threonine protein kinase
MSMTAQPLDGIESDPLIGVRIEGRYRVQRVHSRGGTSVIYSALYEERQREVAIKVLDASIAADPEAVQRFEIEARMGVALAHDNVISVSDFGRLADGRPFLVMPMITGMDMATLLAHQGPQHPRRVAALLKGVASALDLVHRRGCVHRDIKSENLMHVAHPDGSETAIVLDFGLASVRTAPTAVPYVDSSGTPEFMAPEALAGEPLDHRGDVYSLATVAFELMTGSLPFESSDLDDLKHKKANEAPRTLWQAAGAEFPASIEEVMARALSRDRERRQTSAGAFVRELEAAAEDMKVWPLPNAGRKLTSKYPTLRGTGERAQKRTPMTVASARPAPASRTQTLTALADRAQRFSSSIAPSNEAAAARAQRFTSSTPAPPPLGAGKIALPAAPRVPRIDAKPGDEGDPQDTHVRLRPSPPPAEPVKTSTSPAARITRNSRAKALAGTARTSAEAGDSSRTPAPAATSTESGLVLRPARHDPGAATPTPPQPATDVADPQASIIVAASASPAEVPTVDSDASSVHALRPLAATSPALDALEDAAAFRSPRSERAPLIASGIALAALIAFAVFRHPPAPPAPSTTAAAITAAPEPAAKPAPAAAEAAPEVAQPAAPAAPVPAAATDTPPSQDTDETASAAPAAAPEPAASVEPPAKSAGRAGASKKTGAVEKHRASVAAGEPKPASSSAKSGDPARAKQLADQASDLMLRADFVGATRTYQQAIAADASYAPAWRGKGLALERTGKTREAMSAFRRFLKLEPSGANADKIRARLESLEASP